MHPDKASGSDGMNPAFFQAYWDIVGPEVARLVSSIFYSGFFPKELNVTNLVLIPKKDKPENMGDWRPIALCNVVYKIFSKVLANRLKCILSDLVDDNQSAFIPRRSIIDNVVVAFETHHYLKRKSAGKEGYVAIKLDMSKAYDRVSWRFLEAALKALGFDDRWTHLVIECVSTVKYFIQFDKDFLGPIIPKRGLRQGDPQSPYLFILVAEGLSSLIRRAEAKGEVHGVAVCRGAPKISHLLFADDSFLFFKANYTECSMIKRILQDYEKASGQAINYNKSSLTFSQNVDEVTRVSCCQFFNIPRESGQSRYLGLPTLVGRNKSDILSYLRDRSVSRIKNWNNKFLSRAGKAVLIRNVLQALPNYAMNVFLLSKDLCDEIEKLLNGFWWKGNKFDQRGIRWRRWELLCRPKSEWGLGFRRIREFNLAMLAKQGWRLITEPRSLMSRVLKARYFPNTDFLNAKLGNNPSFVWRSFFETQEILRNNTRRRVGHGRDVQVWVDAWLPGQGSGRIQSAKPPGVRDMNVAALRNHTGREWNREMIHSIF
ncbi:unnamed protein product [Cuscuta epithymum]|uniref:Reverse transcriptase domain-containing protein n=1 Tax=Cuscuta epithymum TaxID=186058 RepID=A0AAV0F5A2_9ASTE|nr:unnamed protein product [Cuscuta epithymum]